MNNEIPEQKIELNWMDEELKQLNNEKQLTERKPAIKLEENKIYELEIDFSKPWDKWINPEDGNIKKILPVKYAGIDSVWFLNIKNPCYRQILELGKKGQKKFKIIRSGIAKATRYNLVN